MATTYGYDSGGARHTVTDIKAFDPSAVRHDVTVGYAYTGALRQLVYYRTSPVLSGSSSQWDTAALSWTAPSFPVSTYNLRRGGTLIYSGTALAFTDTGLMPGTAYTYNLEAQYYDNSTESIEANASKSVTTAAYPDLGLSASAAAWNQINLSWAAKVGSVDSFELKRGSTVIYTGLGTSKSDTGLAASTGYSYTLTARRGGTVIKTDTASATTPARPWSTCNIPGPSAPGSGTNHVSSSIDQLSGGTFTMPVAGEITNMSLLMHAYSGGGGKAADIRATLGGAGNERQPFVHPTATSGWTVINLSPYIGAAAGAVAIGGNMGGNSAYYTESQPYSGGDWASNVAWNNVGYRWQALGARAVHVDEAQDGMGNTLARRVRDKETGDILEETGDLEYLDARLADI